MSSRKRSDRRREERALRRKPAGPAPHEPVREVRPSAPPPPPERLPGPEPPPATEAEAPAEPAAPVPPIAWGQETLIVVGLVAATVVAYLPALDNGFLNWDDPAYASTNPNVRELTWRTVRWAFTTFQEGIWHPLTWLSLALDHRIYGLDPRGFHLTNVILHALNTALVFVVWERLTGARWRSAAAAALFGLHPMHVESVAWVTERKDVLSTFFWLLTMGAYARWVRTQTFVASLAVVVAFLLGLLSKPMLVTLPFALLLLDYWPLERLSWRTVQEKLPLLLVALAVAGVGMRAVAAVSAAAVPDPIPPIALVGNAIVSCVRYLQLTLWPFGLSPWYSHPWFEGAPLTASGVGGALLLLLLVTALVVAVARRAAYAPVGWFWFLGTLVPVLGLVYNGRQGMADRYAYVPHVGFFMLVTWTVAALPVWRAPALRAVGAAAFAVVLAGLGILTARQTRVWHDDRTFWTHTARVNRDSFIAHQALAIMEQTEGNFARAVPLYARATRIRPELPRVHVQFARALLRVGKPGLAAAQYRKALEREETPELRYGLAQALIAQGRPASARRQIERALVARPGYVEARRALAALDAGAAASAPTP